MNNSFEPSSFEILSDIKYIFNEWNRVFKEIMLTFDQDHLEDDNGRVENALQSLRQLLASGFD